MIAETPESVALRYLRGEVSVDDAAAQIAALGGLSMGLDTADPELRSKWEERRGRLLWKNLRDLAPDAIGEQPFGAGEFRALQDQVHEKLGRADEADDGG